jgi:2-polyprenyl-6-methoxyphenol hydroxylase-like FAD-dependent oxidoreductase
MLLIPCFRVSPLLPPKQKSKLLNLTVQGQAGAQAIEDGAALGVIFSNFDKTNASSISSRLEHFENIRRNRASVMQMLSNAGQDEADKVREAVLPYMPTKKMPSSYTRDSRGVNTDWL